MTSLPLSPPDPGPLGAVQAEVVHDSQAQAGAQAVVNLNFQVYIMYMYCCSRQ